MCRTTSILLFLVFSCVCLGYEIKSTVYLDEYGLADVVTKITNAYNQTTIVFAREGLYLLQESK